ncbi:MAG: hypothetical protein CMQ34_08765 [Gammaproteobacteria bacterium]|nr:hypothetical protein [Gammaproteobacteria bacterium]|tara:strand:+ start:391 stop:666 length:276 start_codon:yes stop_codon:yes gene_type:complete
MSKRGNFSPGFKQGAVEQVNQPSVSCAQIARERSIGASLLSRWNLRLSNRKAAVWVGCRHGAARQRSSGERESVSSARTAKYNFEKIPSSS